MDSPGTMKDEQCINVKLAEEQRFLKKKVAQLISKAFRKHTKARCVTWYEKVFSSQAAQ